MHVFSPRPRRIIIACKFYSRFDQNIFDRDHAAHGANQGTDFTGLYSARSRREEHIVYKYVSAFVFHENEIATNRDIFQIGNEALIRNLERDIKWRHA